MTKSSMQNQIQFNNKMFPDKPLMQSPVQFNNSVS
ncbi:hypothetical protein SLEP1_g49630 [Rubroshorea leprosula]|uniref:Uncharacterized protein n=1 Tax=Rubroshorea leprosula TaxID=152421 RepID=A0AAV5LYC8_9ROSI|nr:hypothetical protein SLEP1_g49630 [Rubroshorea leprosula]